MVVVVIIHLMTFIQLFIISLLLFNGNEHTRLPIFFVGLEHGTRIKLQRNITTTTNTAIMRNVRIMERVLHSFNCVDDDSTKC